MRALVAAIVAAVTAVLVVVVIVPRIVDGVIVQAELRRLVQDVTGRDLLVHGRIGVDLFPRLRLSLARVEIAAPPAAVAARIEADRLDLDIAPLALAAGRLEARRARAVRPRVTLVGATPAALAAGTMTTLSAAGLQQLESVQIVDGRVERLVDEHGPPHAFLEGLDGTVRRDRLLRRFSVSLIGSAADAPLEVEAEFGETSAGTPATLGFEVTHGGAGQTAHLAFRGFGGTDSTSPAFKGEFEIEAAEPRGIYRLASLASPWRLPVRLPRSAPVLLDGQIELAQGRLVLNEGTARIGPNTLQLTASTALEAPFDFGLRIEASEVLADAGLIDDLGGLMTLPWSATPVAGEVSVQIDLVRWADQPIRQLRAELKLAERGVSVERLTASLPGTADLSLSGLLHPEGGWPRFDGSLALSAEDARATLAALGARQELLPERGLQAMTMSAELALGRPSLALRNFDLRIDGSRIGGSAALIPGERPRLALSAAADRLDLALYRPPPGLMSWPWLRDRLTAFDATVDLAVARASLGELWGDGLYLRASLDQGLVRVSQLGINDLAEARVRLEGSGDLPVESFQLSGEIDADRPTRLLRALGWEAPPTISRFAPVRLKGTARGSRSGTELQVGVNATGLSAQIAASLGPWFSRSREHARLEAQGPRLDEALRNLGLLARDEPGFARPIRVSSTISRAGAGYELAFRSEAPPSDVAGLITVRLGETLTALAGRLSGGVLDRELILGAARQAPSWLGRPEWLGLLAPGELPSWLGRLPETRLDLQALRDLDIALEMETAELRGFDPGGTAGARLRIDQGNLAIDQMRLPVAGGTVNGTATLTAASSFATLGLDLSLSEVRSERLLGSIGIGAAPEGELDLQARLAGSGRTLLELVSSLQGDAQLLLLNGSLPGLGNGSAPVRLLGLSGALAVARGIAVTQPPGLALAIPGAMGAMEIQLDLASWMAQIGLSLSLPEPAERGKTIQRRYVGPPQRLTAVAPTAAQPAAETRANAP